MESETQNTTTADYLSSDIGEVAQRRGGQRNDPLKRENSAQKPSMTRDVAKRLLPACLVTPALLWWVLVFGEHRGWYELDTTLILFVFSVTLAFGAIVCLALRRLGKMDAERARAEEQLQLAKEAAEAANRFKSSFFANISHEIRTPLTAINGFAELMLTPTRSNEDRLGDARVIRRNGEHLLTLINDILDLSKIEAGKMTVEPMICSPATILGEVCALLRMRATEKGLRLNAKFEGNIPATIRTDPTRMRQVLLNLVSNSIKFTKKGSVTVTMSMATTTAVEEPILQVKIEDTGIGIAEDKIKALFTPFVQGDATITRQYGGTGLGLAISRHFVRALGGDITAASEPNKGSTFTVTVKTGSLIGVSVLVKPEEALQLQDNFVGPNIRMVGSVLVAEDGIDNQALIATRLREAGLKVEIAADGKIACDKALAAIQLDRPFDAILMDVQMPVMDGYNATLFLRSKAYRGPIIALTANAMERDRQKCLNAGCNDFVTKPIQMSALFKALGRYLPLAPAESNSKAAETASQEIKVREFSERLPELLTELEEASEREDRSRLKDLLQLMLGQSASAGQKDIAAESARLLQSAGVEGNWAELRQAVATFSRSYKPKSTRQAA